MDASLRTQIRAMQSRIDSVTATATPEDIVMLAKGMEAVAGQATVFDILDAGEEAAAKALDAIKAAKDEALDAVAEAGELPEDIRQDLSLIKGRNRAVSVSIPVEGAEIADATTGYIRAVAEGETGALRLPALTPEWLAEETNMQILTICNDGRRTISVRDAEEREVCVIPAGMYALVFVAGDGDSLVWHGTRFVTTADKAIVDQEEVYLDTAAASQLSMTMGNIPVACWYSNAARVCTLGFEDGVLIPVQTITVTTTGNEARIVAYDGTRQFMMVTRSSSNFYGVMITADSDNQLTAGTSQLLFTVQSGYSFSNWILLQKSIVYSAYYSSSKESYCWSRTISYNAGEDTFAVGGNTQIFKRAEAYNYAHYLGSGSAATVGSTTLVVESNGNQMYPGAIWTGNGRSANWSSGVSASYSTYCQAVFALNTTSFLLLWAANQTSGIFWRFGKLSGSYPSMGSYGLLTPSEYQFYDNTDWFDACVIDNSRVAIVTGGGPNKRATLSIGSLSENADNFIHWAEPIFLPLVTQTALTSLKVTYDSAQRVLYVLRAMSGVGPHILPVKL